MELSRSESLTLVAAVIGAAVLGSQSLNLGFGAAALGDIAILLTVFAFDSAAARSGAQSLAFAGACGFCLLTPFQLLANALSPVTAEGRPYWLMPFVWLIATVLLFAVDRFRVSSRESVTLAGAGGLTGPASAKPFTVNPSPNPTYRPAPIRVAPPPPPAPVPPVPITEDFPTNISDPVVSPVAVAVSAPVPAPPPMADVMAIPPGRETLIYLNLVGEGLNVLRTVRAENLGRDYFRIADIMPEGEQWEFSPGQVVRCRKKSLSNGKHMVAFEEAPRAQ